MRKNNQPTHYYQYLLIRRSVSGYYFVSEGFHDHAGLIAYATTAPLASRLSPSATTNEEESEITSTVWITGSMRNYSLLEFPKDVTYDADVQQGARIPAPSEPYL